MGDDLLVASEKEPLPLAFNVEVGAYINVLRTSLDILATTLGRRHGITKLDDAYFPIVDSQSKFLAGNYKGQKIVQRLPPVERSILEQLKPYRGGHDVLWALHSLDIKRKHQRLLTVEPHPAMLSITAVNIDKTFTPLPGGQWVRGYQETMLGFIRKGAPKPKVQFSAFIGFDEPETGMSHVVLEALDQFARVADSIIDLFDAP